jgi:alpha-1,2-mannosyltransferase
MPILDRERLNTYPKIIFFLSVFIYGFLIISGSGNTDAMGKPIGADFTAFWATSTLVLSGDAVQVYENERIFAVEKSITGVEYRNPIPYPPTYFLIVAPLALLPYIPSLILWLLLTFSGLLLVTWRCAPHPLTVWLILSFPGTFQNIIHGHNGFLVASILGAALLIIGRYPFAAGTVLGLLSFKPHLVMIIPLFLVAGRMWRVLAGMGTSICLLVLVSVLLFGVDAWVKFLIKIPFMVDLLKGGYLQMHQVISTLSALLLAGVPYKAAISIHLISAFVAIALTARAWHKEEPRHVKNSLLVLTILIVTPYANTYDLTLLALPICWLGWEAYQRCRTSRLESFFLAAAWFLPMVCVVMAFHMKVQPVPFFLLSMLIWIYKDESLKSGAISA